MTTATEPKTLMAELLQVLERDSRKRSTLAKHLRRALAAEGRIDWQALMREAQLGVANLVAAGPDPEQRMRQLHAAARRAGIRISCRSKDGLVTWTRVA